MENITSKECVICFEFMNRDLGELPCNHIFCFDCIHKWSKKDAVCPLCRDKFNHITKSNPNPVNEEYTKRTKVPIRRKAPNRRVRFSLPGDEIEEENRRIRMQVRQQMISDLRNERVAMNRFYFQTQFPCPGFQSDPSTTFSISDAVSTNAPIQVQTTSTTNHNDESQLFSEALDLLSRPDDVGQQSTSSEQSSLPNDESWIDQLIENL